MARNDTAREGSPPNGEENGTNGPGVQKTQGNDHRGTGTTSQHPTRHHRTDSGPEETQARRQNRARPRKLLGTIEKETEEEDGQEGRDDRRQEDT